MLPQPILPVTLTVGYNPQYPSMATQHNTVACLFTGFRRRAALELARLVRMQHLETEVQILRMLKLGHGGHHDRSRIFELAEI
jgi:hypothetical protein